MSNLIENLHNIDNLTALSNEELVIREFAGESDFPKMIGLIQECSKEDGIERADTLEAIRNTYRHLVNCDTAKDMIMVEAGDELVAYYRGFWRVEQENNWIYHFVCFVHPQWRKKGIGTLFVQSAERRAKELVEQVGVQMPAYTEAELADTQTAALSLFGEAGYGVVRYFSLMVRPDLENIPDLPLPAGIEIREVLPEHYSKIYDASMEAFRDHWGFSPEAEDPLEAWLESPYFDPSLWRVAWQGDEVVGMVLSFIDHAENQNYGRKRGYTENIAVRRPWRKMGVARALIAASLKAVKERGMEEAALGVDTQNLSGAFRLYEGMGYQHVKRFTLLRKAIE